MENNSKVTRWTGDLSCNQMPLHYDGRRSNFGIYRSLTRYLVACGRVCPKPWYWARFYFVFTPGYESIWLSDWWQTTDIVKRQRFFDQLRDLALHSDNFPGAYFFLHNLDSGNWHYEQQGIQQVEKNRC